MESEDNAINRPFNRKLDYLETYLEEHPKEVSPLTITMQDELHVASGLSEKEYANYTSAKLEELYREAKKIRKSERKESEAAYKAQWDGYQCKLNIPTPFDPKHDIIPVRITRQDGEEYLTQFITRSYLDYVFEKNKKTGECADGTYFWMPGMIVVDKEITERTVKSTIDELIEHYSMDRFIEQEENN